MKIMEKFFIKCTIDVNSLVDKLPSSCPTKININRTAFSET